MLLKNAPLYYPSAREWMWNYCIYLGPFTDSKGNNFDLGIYIDYSEHYEEHSYSNATVFGNEPGNYSSGDFINSQTFREVILRANELNLIDSKSQYHKDSQYLKDNGLYI